MNKSITSAILFFFLSTSYATEIDIKEYCSYKQSAKALTVNLPLNVKYKDGFMQKTQLYISCRYGYKCLGFYTGGEHFNTYIFDDIKVKHMGRDSVTLSDTNFDEFLFDIKNKSIRWVQGNTGIVSEFKCNKFLSE